jgi:hypothetical protein
MYKPVESTLRTLHEEFKRASASFPPLYHEQVFDLIYDGDLITLDDARKAYLAWRSVRSEEGRKWQWWHGPHKTGFGGGKDTGKGEFKGQGYTGPAGEWYGRFFGCGDGLEEFLRLAESTYLVLCEMELPLRTSTGGWIGFVEFLYELAERQATPLLRATGTMLEWGGDDWVRDSEEEQPAAAQNEGADQAAHDPSPENNIIATECPPIPYVQSLRLNLFTCSMAAIQMLLDPESILLVTDMEDGKTVSGGPKFSVAPAGVEESGTPSKDGGDEGESEKKADFEKPGTEPDYLFRFEKGRWHLRYKTDDEKVEDYSYQDDKGFRYYARLLGSPGERVACFDLSPHGQAADERDVARLKGRAELTSPTDFNTNLNAEPGHYRRGANQTPDEPGDQEGNAFLTQQKIRELEDHLEIARSTGADSIDELDQRLKQAKLKQAKAALRTGGNRPVWSPSQQELARGRVSIALSRCRDKIAKEMPDLASYLKGALQLIDRNCAPAYTYQPSDSIEWITD